MARSFASRAAFLAVTTLMSLGCGGAAVLRSGPAPFGEWSDDQGASAGALWDKLKDTPAAKNASVAVGVARGKLVGVPLDGSAKWTASYALDARPVVAGNLVVATGGGELVAFDAATGKKSWSVAEAGSLRGAGDDGQVTAVVLGLPKGSALVTVDRSGRVLTRVATDVSLGVPAVRGGIVFVPWSSQYVSAVDATSGAEVGRILVREKTSHAFSAGGQLYFGEGGIFRFDDKIRFASQKRASHVAIPPREFAGSPTLMSPPEQKLPLVAGARDRIRLYARPDAQMALDSGRYYATYYRIVMGLAAERGRLAWVASRGADVLGGAAGSGLLAVCDAGGKVALLAAQNGATVKELDAGEPLESCTVAIDDVSSSERPAAPSLAEQLSRVLANKDAELATAHRLLLRELASLEDEIATKALVELIADPKTPVPVAADARVALGGRRNGGKYMVEALGRHYDFLNDVLKPPPSGPIAQALGRLKEPGAPAALAAHLTDPATPDADLHHVAAALGVVARPEEMKELSRFFAMYHGTAAGDEQELAVVNVAQAMLRLGGKDAKATVEAAVARRTTSATLKARLTALLEAQKGAKEGPPETAPAAEGDPKKGDAKKDAPKKPGAKGEPKKPAP